MKRLNVLTIYMIIAFIMPVFNVSAKEFKGVITYKVSVTGSTVTDDMKAMMPKTMTLTIKGNKARSEMTMGMGTTVSITDGETKTTTTLLDMMGQKIAFTTSTDEIMKEIKDSPSYTVEKTSETKDILGYKCTKAIIRSDDGAEINVFYTSELGSGAINFDNAQFKDIDGVMLEFEMPDEGMSMKFTAVDIQHKNVSDSEFEIPEGYQVKSKDEFKSMFGGGN